MHTYARRAAQERRAPKRDASGGAGAARARARREALPPAPAWLRPTAPRSRRSRRVVSARRTADGRRLAASGLAVAVALLLDSILKTSSQLSSISQRAVWPPRTIAILLHHYAAHTTTDDKQTHNHNDHTPTKGHVWPRAERPRVSACPPVWLHRWTPSLTPLSRLIIIAPTFL